MHRDIDRKGALVGLLNWAYEEFKDNLPSLVRLPVHLALCIAHKASPEQRAALKNATQRDVLEAVEASQLAAQYQRHRRNNSTR